jgi:hypothetical protein
MSRNALHGAIAERMHEHHNIPHQTGQRESCEIDALVAARVPACCTSEAALVGSYSVVACFGELREYAAPGVGDFGETVEEYY